MYSLRQCPKCDSSDLRTDQGVLFSEYECITCNQCHYDELTISPSNYFRIYLAHYEQHMAALTRSMQVEIEKEVA